MGKIDLGTNTWYETWEHGDLSQKHKQNKKQAINHVIQEKRQDKKLDEALKKKVYGQQLKSYIHTPLNLKSKIWNQGEEDGGYEHDFVFLEKREESRRFDVFLFFWREIW